MIYLQITSGRGPVECELAVQKIPQFMQRELRPSDPRDEPWNLTFGVIKQDKHSAIISLDGPEARIYADTWIGSVKWICPSPIRKDHKRKTWYVGVREIQLPLMDNITIQESDLVWETRKASSKGGQNANKTANLVRLTHTPTGIVVIGEDERSQKQNRIIALGRLRQALLEKQQTDISRIETENWMQHNQIERGNPVRIFEGLDFVERV